MLMEIILIFLMLIYVYHKWAFEYWKKKNVFSIQGEFFFGSIKDILFGKKSLNDLVSEMYDEHKTQGLVGFYSFYRPMLLITDTELIKDVLVTNFKSFADNGYRVYEEADPMFGINPFCISGHQNWKKVRGLHSPFHTTGKLKEIFPVMKQVGKHLVQYIEEHNLESLNMSELTGYYTMENISSCAYGLEPNVFSDVKHAFRNCGSENLFTFSPMADFSAVFFPSFARILKLRIISKHAENFFVSIVKSLIDHKTKDLSPSNDFISYLLRCHEKELKEGRQGFSDKEFAGHCVTIYIDGYETTSSAIIFVLLEIANHPEIQEKLRNEIFSVGNHIDNFDFENICSLSYLTLVINESLRKYPLLPVLSRECTERTELGGVVVDKGTKVFIPVNSLHHDAELYQDPDVFIPERFEDENNIVKCSNLPFGGGPRMCLGSKLALLQIKVAVVFILLKFKVLPSSGKEREDIILAKNSPLVVRPDSGTRLSFSSL